MDLEKLKNNKWVWNISILVIFFGIIGLIIITTPYIYESHVTIQPMDNNITSERVAVIEQKSYDGVTRHIITNNSEMKFVGWKTSIPKFSEFQQVNVGSVEEFEKLVGDQKVYHFIISGIDGYSTEYSVTKTYVSFMPDKPGVYVYETRYKEPDTFSSIMKYDDDNIYWESNNGDLVLIITLAEFLGDLVLLLYLACKKDRHFKKGRCSCCS